MKNLSYHEKSLWISLITTTLVFAYYFLKLFLQPADTDGPLSLGMHLFTTLSVIIVIQISLQAVLASRNRKEANQPADEWQQKIEAAALRVSHWILIIGVWISGLLLLVQDSTPLILHTLLFFFVLSEGVGYAKQLYFYRKGV